MGVVPRPIRPDSNIEYGSLIDYLEVDWECGYCDTVNKGTFIRCQECGAGITCYSTVR